MALTWARPGLFVLTLSFLSCLARYFPTSHVISKVYCVPLKTKRMIKNLAIQSNLVIFQDQHFFDTMLLFFICFYRILPSNFAKMTRFPSIKNSSRFSSLAIYRRHSPGKSLPFSKLGFLKRYTPNLSEFYEVISEVSCVLLKRISRFKDNALFSKL